MSGEYLQARSKLWKVSYYEFESCLQLRMVLCAQRRTKHSTKVYLSDYHLYRTNLCNRTWEKKGGWVVWDIRYDRRKNVFPPRATFCTRLFRGCLPLLGIRPSPAWFRKWTTVAYLCLRSCREGVFFLSMIALVGIKSVGNRKILKIPYLEKLIHFKNGST